MLQDQFFTRLMLLLAVGAVYVMAYMNMAKRNSKEVEPQRHLALKIFGGFWALLSIILGIAGVYMITKINFPQEALGPYISANMIFRPSYQTMYWGYATSPQFQCISMINGMFGCLALSAYCFMYKSSHSKWYTKVGKVFFCVLFYMFFVSATDFHYFDIYEWISPVLFTIMAFFAFRNKQENDNEAQIEVQSNINTTPQVKDSKENPSNSEDNSKFMPRVINDKDFMKSIECETQDINRTSQTESPITDILCKFENELDNSTIVDDIKNEKDSIDEQSTRVQPNSVSIEKFCRHCGGEVNYQSDRYCKHCGMQLK